MVAEIINHHRRNVAAIVVQNHDHEARLTIAASTKNTRHRENVHVIGPDRVTVHDAGKLNHFFILYLTRDSFIQVC